MRTYEVRLPEHDADDFYVQVFARDLSRWRGELALLAVPRKPFAEVLLGTMGAAGAAFSAWIVGMDISSNEGVMSFGLLPLVAVGCFVGFWFTRQISNKKVSGISSEVLDDMPDPDQTVSAG